ncbi:MAG: KilA-N domain-containing protein [Proteobacteria bacterium]|nr:KilA-N domain-containing protein [Pseudomonadota bacterium]
MSALVLATYNGQEVTFTDDGWFNATEAAAKFGKRPVDWLKLPETKRYIAALADRTKVKESHFARARRGGRRGEPGPFAPLKYRENWYLEKDQARQRGRHMVTPEAWNPFCPAAPENSSFENGRRRPGGGSGANGCFRRPRGAGAIGNCPTPTPMPRTSGCPQARGPHLVVEQSTRALAPRQPPLGSSLNTRQRVQVGAHRACCAARVRMSPTGGGKGSTRADVGCGASVAKGWRA